MPDAAPDGGTLAHEVRYECGGPGLAEPPEWHSNGAAVRGPPSTWRRPPQPLVLVIVPPQAAPSQCIANPCPSLPCRFLSNLCPLLSKGQWRIIFFNRLQALLFLLYAPSPPPPGPPMMAWGMCPNCCTMAMRAERHGACLDIAVSDCGCHDVHGECYASSAHTVGSFEFRPILRPFFLAPLTSFWFHTGFFLASYAFGMWHI